MPRPMHAHRGLAQASRLEVAYHVMERPGISLAELSEETGLHAMCIDIGIVEQWYIQMPACVAVKR